MEFICPAINNVTSLFPSPVQSPVPYGTGLDFWAEWPANSNTDFSGKCQLTEIYDDTFRWKKNVIV
jgi:hypothetical protein